MAYAINDILPKYVRQKAEIENYSHNIKNLTAENMRLIKEIEQLKKSLNINVKSEITKQFADKLYRFFTKKENWRMMKDEWLLNDECEWLKESIYKVRQEIIGNKLNKDNVKESVGE